MHSNPTMLLCPFFPRARSPEKRTPPNMVDHLAKEWPCDWSLDMWEPWTWTCQVQGTPSPVQLTRPHCSSCLQMRKGGGPVGKGRQTRPHHDRWRAPHAFACPSCQVRVASATHLTCSTAVNTYGSLTDTNQLMCAAGLLRVKARKRTRQEVLTRGKLATQPEPRINYNQ